jgi:HrpA-like RNA helicase
MRLVLITIYTIQPRRIAAVSLAERVQKELDASGLDSALGINTDGVVSHHVRFDDTRTQRTRICFMTEGMLLRSSYEKPWFPDYDVIIVDEAHERSITLDTLLSALLDAQKIRSCLSEDNSLPKLKVIIMTATGDVERFRTFFSAR